MANSIKLSIQNSSNFIVLQSRQIKVVEASGTGSLVNYSVDGASWKQVEVKETPSVIDALNNELGAFTLSSNSATIYINVWDIYKAVASGSDSAIILNVQGAYPKEFIVTEDLDTIEGIIDGVISPSVISSKGLMRLEYDFATKSAAKTFVDADVSVSADTITIASHGFVNNDTIRLTTTGTLPAGLATGTTYYVVNATSNTFQLSATAGGAAVNITAAAGGGTHTATSNVFGNITFGELGTLPDNAIVTRSWVDVITTFVSASDAATIGFGIQTNDVNGIIAPVAISAATDWDAGYHEGIQTGTAANFAVKTTAERLVEMPVAVEELTAGKLVIFLEYVVSE